MTPSPMTRWSAVWIATALTLPACEDPPKSEAKSEPVASAAPAASVATPAAPSGPPDVSIGELDAKVGWATVLIGQPDGRSRLDTELAPAKEHIDGKSFPLRVARKAKMAWVVMAVDALADLGAATIVLKTETRKEFPAELTFTPLARVNDPAPCSMVAMILEDRGTAVWKIAGGMANKRGKGFAGPDLSMTGETIERRAPACDSKLFFVSAAEVVEWGLAYDLAASVTQLDKNKASFDTFVLLHVTPVAGRKVDLSAN